jgi:hypothetical protein
MAGIGFDIYMLLARRLDAGLESARPVQLTAALPVRPPDRKDEALGGRRDKPEAAGDYPPRRVRHYEPADAPAFNPNR